MKGHRIHPGQSVARFAAPLWAPALKPQRSLVWFTAMVFNMDFVGLMPEPGGLLEYLWKNNESYILHRQRCALPESSCLPHPTTGSLPRSPGPQHQGLYLAGCDLIHILSLCKTPQIDSLPQGHRQAVSGLFHRKEGGGMERGLGTGNL